MKFYNTIHRREENFTPLVEGKVGLYTCGPTVYDYAHIGNFRAYIFEDLLRRFLESSGYQVTHVMNITDIDDKTIRRAREQGLSLQTFTDKYIQAFHDDISTLNIHPAHHYPRATEFVPQMIDMIKMLDEKGFAYALDDGSVFFKVAQFSQYGQLANLNPDQLRIGNRVVNDEYDKEEVRDFALWKGAKANEEGVYWESPWGRGRPGWHIECSVMSMHYLGTHFDIHCGGVDNIFPHHENEIAQSCAATGDQFVNYWLHNEHLMVDGEKMAKSADNFYTQRDLLDRDLTPEAIRYTLLTTHYRQKLNFTFEKVSAAQKSINRLRELQRRLEQMDKHTAEPGPDSCGKVWQDFMTVLGDDLNISGALGILFTWVNEQFALLDAKTMSRSSAKNALLLLSQIDQMLGVIAVLDTNLDDEIQDLIDQRNQARKDCNWAEADRIRDHLKGCGIILEDTSGGTIWKRSS